MWRALGVLALAAALGGLVFGLVYAPEDGLLMGLFMVACGAPVIVAAHLLVARRRAAGSLGRQFAGAVALTTGLVTLGVFSVALLMFISHHDAVVMTMLLLLAGGLTAYSTWLLSRDVIAQRDAAESARRDLVAAVSHDLRTPLTSLRLLSEAIEDELVDRETRRSYLEQMSVHIRSLSGLIEDLFELSRLEAGDIQWSLARVRIDELVEETVEAMRAQADARHVEVRAAVPGDLAPARANPEKLQRVLFNLIQNAIRHTPADGSVTVLAESNGRTVEVEVADTGEGVAGRRPRARLRALLPRRSRRRPVGRRHRARPHHLPRDRGGARRRDLVRRLAGAAPACASACPAPDSLPLMDVVVAGGHGQIALELLRLLAERGDRARGLIRNPDHGADLEAVGAEPVICDMEAEPDLARFVDGADAVVFAAGAGPGSGPERKRTVDLGAAVKLIDAARAASIGRYLMISAIGVTDPARATGPMRPYYDAKAEADEALAESGLDWTIVRPGRLTDEPGTGRVRAGVDIGYGEVPRDDVAATLAAVLATDSTIGKAFDLLEGDTPVDQAVRSL